MQSMQGWLRSPHNLSGLHPLCHPEAHLRRLENLAEDVHDRLEQLREKSDEHECL